MLPDDTGGRGDTGDSPGAGDPRLQLARQWLEKARHDLQAAERAAQPKPLPDIAAYHAQQAAEKALKGYLAWRDQPFRRTHDLVEFVHLCEALDEGFRELLPAAHALAPFSSEPRYPGEPHSDPSIDEVEEGRRHAERVVEFVMLRLPHAVD